MTENLNALRLQGRKNADHTKVQYKNNDGDLILSVGKKEFSHSDHQKIFKQEWVNNKNILLLTQSFQISFINYFSNQSIISAQAIRQRTGSSPGVPS